MISLFTAAKNDDCNEDTEEEKQVALPRVPFQRKEPQQEVQLVMVLKLQPLQ